MLHVYFSWEFFRGGVPPGSPNPDPISDQKFAATDFRGQVCKWVPFSDLEVVTKHNIQSCLQRQIMSFFLPRLACQQKDFLKIHFKFAYNLLFLLHSFWSAFIQYCSPLENHIWFHTKMGKIYTCFETKTAQKTHTYMAYITEYPPPPPQVTPLALSYQMTLAHALKWGTIKFF